jgi:hypothetical protein
MGKSYANGNRPDPVAGTGARPAEITGTETTHWVLVLGVSPGAFAS